MKFTKTEWEIIEHRLGVPDCIAEVLEGEGFNYQEVEDRVYELQSKGCDAVDMDSRVDRAILEDCCDGCTFFNDIQDAAELGEISRGTMMARFKAARSLGVKLGTEVTIH